MGLQHLGELSVRCSELYQVHVRDEVVHVARGKLLGAVMVVELPQLSDELIDLTCHVLSSSQAGFVGEFHS
jgi:hypothetical protein